jgi:hypothetical protein
MQLLLSHWHCILPVVAIGTALFFMQEKPDKGKNSNHDALASIKEQNNMD